MALTQTVVLLRQQCIWELEISSGSLEGLPCRAQSPGKLRHVNSSFVLVEQILKDDVSSRESCLLGLDWILSTCHGVSGNVGFCLWLANCDLLMP